jgi:predicted PurR-regulated permease PerM
MSQNSELTVKISPSILLHAVLLALSIWLFAQIKSIIFMAFIAYIISVGLNTSVDRIEQKLRWPRWTGVLLSYFGFVLILAAFLVIIFPPLVKELSILLYTIQIPTDFSQELQSFEVNLSSIKGLMDTFGASVNTAMTVIGSTFSSVFIVITTLVISLYMSLEKPSLIKSLSSLSKNPIRVEALRKFFQELDMQLGNWIRGQFILMTVIGLITFISLIILQIPYALPIAIIAGLLEIIPNIGPIFSAVPAVIIAFLAFGWPSALTVLVLYIVIQQLENNLIVPKIMRSSVDINPLISILGILIGGTLFGVVGALLAVPLFIVGRTVLVTWKKYW